MPSVKRHTHTRARARTHTHTHRGSYLSAHILLDLLNVWGNEIKCEACRALYLFFATSLINLIIQVHEC